ncbi:hypothetical protein CTheo_6546 [Ceratobasidium theobromae]|uniref:SnoaL-like domain-containing protein n=1 Tax=Ceratobasidium theobromae TaxID=1582974 RepID=A0A5N5QEX3_9AGAM|nr:hypothetical protein CTheo_6546 [Ceratobasidium theobromae]
MSRPVPQVSAPGLSDGEMLKELRWLEEFIGAADSLDWSKWEKYWDDNAFLQFCNCSKIEGKEAIAHHWQEKLGVLEQMEHTEIVRRSFDRSLGIIYQTEKLRYKIKGDPHARVIDVSGLAVIHKKIGSDVITGFETYIDQEPIVTIVRELRAMAMKRSQ